MKIVRSDEAAVERALLAGGIACPDCEGELRPWGHARSRPLRCGSGERRLRPRRGRCRSCLVSHVLLPERCLRRRRDDVGVIGSALVAKAGGAGHRRIARRLGLPPSTVRGWLRRFARAAEGIRAFFTALAHALDPAPAPLEPAGSAFADALAALGAAVRAAVRRLGPRDPWPLASAATAGGLLSNTSCPWAGHR